MRTTGNAVARVIVLASAMAATLASRPRAIVYRGPAGGPGLSEAVAELLESSPRNFQVQYAGPNETIDITSETLSGVDLFAQPGGPDIGNAWKHNKKYAAAVREFVSGGGRYLGFCLGAYMAGYTPGYGLLPNGADTDSEIEQDGAQVDTDEDTIIQVDWRFATGPKAGQVAKNRWIFFQEGAVIDGFEESDTSFILARYSKTSDVAATLNKYGEGWVGLVGPHPEASQDWFDDEDIDSPDGLQYEIGYDLIEATMQGGVAHSESSSNSSSSDTRTSGSSRIRNPLGYVLGLR